MTRNEFIDNITEWCELKDFATTLTAISVRTSMTMMITMTASKKISAMLSPTTAGGTSETSLTMTSKTTNVVTAPLIMMVSMATSPAGTITTRMSSNGAMTTAHGTTRKMKMKSTPMQMTTSSILWKRNPTKMKPLRKRISPSMTSSVCAV